MNGSSHEAAYANAGVLSEHAGDFGFGFSI
jgi:hypothetical protein